MDPLDPEYSFKFLTGGAPLRLEKVLDIEVKADSLKTTALVGAITASVVAGAAAAYYWFKKQDEDEEVEEDEENDTIITTTTTTTTTYLSPPLPIPTTSTTTTTCTPTTTTKAPLQPPKMTVLPPIKMTKDNGEPLSAEEQNRILANENKVLKKDLETLNNWVNIIITQQYSYQRPLY
eukprot:gene3666-4220_t